MSGNPTEAEIQTQWRAAVRLLETARNYADGTVAGAGGLLDTLTQALEGEYTPAGLTGAMARFRGIISSLIDPVRAQDFLQPVLFEYGRLITFGGGFSSIAQLAEALYEHFHRNTLTVQSRNITYDATATLGGTNVGAGTMSRLTVDRRGYNLESCHVETKRFRCRQDENTGAQLHAEQFEMLGTAAPSDSLLRASFGSGDQQRATIRSLNAGTGQGGSLLRNSSFSTYSATATPKFAGWTETSGGASIVQNTAATYRSFPGQTVAGSLQINGGGGTVLLKQPLSEMRISRLEPNTPYFYRVMLNKTVGTASGGTVTIRIGSQSANISIASLASNWAELRIPAGTACWPLNFNEANFDVEIEWASSTSGYLLVDDVILAPWDELDGTYWVLTQTAATPTAWKVDDTLEFTDTGGAPATGKIQWWFWLAGLGYLPSTTGTPSFTDPA